MSKSGVSMKLMTAMSPQVVRGKIPFTCSLIMAPFQLFTQVMVLDSAVSGQPTRLAGTKTQ